MPRKKRQRYGDYCEVIDGELYGSINIPIGGGKYRRKRHRVDSRTDARNWALGELERVKHGTGNNKLETFLDLVEWYKEHFLVAPVYERGLKIEGTKDWQKSRNKLERMAEHFGPKRLSHFSERDLLVYARARRESVTQATINRDLALLRSMFRKGHQADSSIKLPRFPINTAAENERERVMTLEEEKKILAACESLETLEYERNGKKIKTEKHQTNRQHLRDLIIVAVDTAMREGEIFKLKWSDIDLEAGTITVQKQNAKIQRMRKVGMTSRVKQIFASRPHSGGTIFEITSCYKAFKTACTRAKINDLNFHDLRHTATTRMIRAGIPHTEVMKITGHTQIKTFLRYLNLGNETIQNAAGLLERSLQPPE